MPKHNLIKNTNFHSIAHYLSREQYRPYTADWSPYLKIKKYLVSSNFSAIESMLKKAMEGNKETYQRYFELMRILWAPTLNSAPPF